MNEIEEKLSIITKACEDRKATDIKEINISEMSSIADYFVIASGNSSTQTQGIADEIEDKMYEKGYMRLSREGYQSGRWILLDYEDVIVHIFHKEEREYYNLERLWVERPSEE